MNRLFVRVVRTLRVAAPAGAILLALPPAAAPAFAGPESSAKPAPAPARYAEKAGVVLELIPFVDWPAPAGARPAREAGDRPIRVRSFRNLDEVDPCPILVIGREKARLLPVILDFLHGTQGVLTVADRSDFAAEGGMVRLVELPDRVGFEINRAAA